MLLHETYISKKEKELRDKKAKEAIKRMEEIKKAIEIQTMPKSFDLDHLTDINPKRLFETCKFRAKIHDIIDENGNFWVEVIYSPEGNFLVFFIIKFLNCQKLFKFFLKLFIIEISSEVS